MFDAELSGKRMSFIGEFSACLSVSFDPAQIPQFCAHPCFPGQQDWMICSFACDLKPCLRASHLIVQRGLVKAGRMRITFSGFLIEYDTTCVLHNASSSHRLISLRLFLRIIQNIISHQNHQVLIVCRLSRIQDFVRSHRWIG